MITTNRSPKDENLGAKNLQNTWEVNSKTNNPARKDAIKQCGHLSR
jgi:hypothetical protein